MVLAAVVEWDGVVASSQRAKVFSLPFGPGYVESLDPRIYEIDTQSQL